MRRFSRSIRIGRTCGPEVPHVKTTAKFTPVPQHVPLVSHVPNDSQQKGSEPALCGITYPLVAPRGMTHAF